MAHDIFISYSTKDKQTADAICHVLEQNNMKCWIAPRDISGGKNYAEEIMDGIRTAKLVVLVFSRNSQESSFVNNEIDNAFSLNKPIISFKIDETMPEDKMEFFLKTKHWLEAYPKPEKVFSTLVNDAYKLCDEERNQPIIIDNNYQNLNENNQKNKLPSKKKDLISFILVFTPLYFVSFLYMGYKTKKIPWIINGAIYAIPLILLYITDFSSTINTNRFMVVSSLYSIFWGLAIVHVLLSRKEFLARNTVLSMMSKDDELYEELVKEYMNF